MRESLTVIATKTPESVPGYRLAWFPGPGGGHITNADLSAHADPRTGRIVEARGRKVENVLDPDKSVGVRCKTCSTINVMGLAQASRMRSIHCVVCASELEYELSEDHEEDETETEDDGESVEYDFDDSEGEDSEDEGEGEEESEEEYLGGDDLEEVDVSMPDMVDEDEDLAFVRVDDAILAMSGDATVAVLRDTESEAWPIADTAAFASGFRKVIADHGMKKALVSAGFVPVVIKASAILARAAKRAHDSMEAASDRRLDADLDRYARCLDIAAAGSIKGMFRKQGGGVLRDEMTKVLESFNVRNAPRVTEAVLSKAAARHAKALMEVASDLMGRSDEALAAVAEQIEDLALPSVETASDEASEAETRLEKGAKPVEKTETKASAADGEPRRLFR